MRSRCAPVMQNVKAQNVNANITTPLGRILYIDSEAADVTQHNVIATLIGNVVVPIDTGYRLVTELLEYAPSPPH